MATVLEAPVESHETPEVSDNAASVEQVSDNEPEQTEAVAATPVEDNQHEPNVQARAEAARPPQEDPAVWLKRISAANRRVYEAKRRWQSLKADTKEAKDEYDEEVADLTCIIRAYENDLDRPLFRNVATDVHEARAEPQAEPATAEPAIDDESWRETTLEQLGFVEGRITKALTDAGLTTLGAIADYTKSNQLTTIKGIGPTAATEIEESMDEFWRGRNAVELQNADPPELKAYTDEMVAGGPGPEDDDAYDCSDDDPDDTDDFEDDEI